MAFSERDRRADDWCWRVRERVNDDNAGDRGQCAGTIGAGHGVDDDNLGVDDEFDGSGGRADDRVAVAD